MGSSEIALRTRELSRPAVLGRPVYVGAMGTGPARKGADAGFTALDTAQARDVADFKNLRLGHLCNSVGR